MRRRRLLIVLTAMATALSGAFLFGGTGAGADTATPEIADEAWFARYAPPAPQVPVPCELPRPGGTGCGPTSITGAPTPQSKQTGHYVVASAGGTFGDDSATSGDTAWAAFKWDLSEQTGATVERFVVRLTQGVDNKDPNGTPHNQGDTWKAGDEILPIQACNVLEDWGGANGSNPWDGRPTDSRQCVVPTVSGSTYIFDVTSFAQSWIDRTAYGMVIMPGTPTQNPPIKPFQITFAGTYDATASPATKPQVTFQYSPAVEEDLFGGFEEFGGGGDESFFEEISVAPSEEVLEAVPDIDVIPTDEGSEPLPEDVATTEAPIDLAAPPGTGGTGTRPISRDVSFPWLALLLLPLIAVGFWSTGTALGPIGDPVPARSGGVSRVLAQRQAAHGSSHFETRN